MDSNVVWIPSSSKYLLLCFFRRNLRPEKFNYHAILIIMPAHLMLICICNKLNCSICSLIPELIKPFNCVVKALKPFCT